MQLLPVFRDPARSKSKQTRKPGRSRECSRCVYGKITYSSDLVTSWSAANSVCTSSYEMVRCKADGGTHMSSKFVLITARQRLRRDRSLQIGMNETQRGTTYECPERAQCCWISGVFAWISCNSWKAFASVTEANVNGESLVDGRGMRHRLTG